MRQKEGDGYGEKHGDGKYRIIRYPVSVAVEPVNNKRRKARGSRYAEGGSQLRIDGAGEESEHRRRIVVESGTDAAHLAEIKRDGIP